jgi:hypothetical protein
VYFWARLAHYVIYTMGVPVLRADLRRGGRRAGRAGAGDPSAGVRSMGFAEPCARTFQHGPGPLNPSYALIFVAAFAAQALIGAEQILDARITCRP